jgi:AsmA family protein
MPGALPLARPASSARLERMAIQRRLPRAARITGTIIGSIMVVLVLFLALVDWNLLRGPLARMASADLHRQVTIDHLAVHLWRRNPEATLDGLKIANPGWAQTNGSQMIEIDSITVAIEPWPLLRGRLALARLQIDHPQVTLLRDASNRANWDFSSDQEKKKLPQKPGAPAQLPAVHLFTMTGGTLKVQDQIRKLTFDGGVNAKEDSSHSAQSFELRGHGELNGKGFDLSFGGSPLFNLQLDQPYDYDAQVHAGPLQVSAKGAIDKPFDLAHLSANVDFKGENLASLYYLTGLALPFTPPFHLSADLRRDGMLFTLQKLQGTVGDSDLHGDMRVDASGTRPKLTANLISHALDLADLAPSVGAGVADDKTAGKSDTEAPKTLASNKLLPTYQFDFDRLRSMDADVELKADSVKTQKMPIETVDLRLVLNDGVLTLDPADLILPQGKLASAIRINAQHNPADTHIDIRLSDVKLAQFKSAKMAESPLDGDLLSRVELEGHGNSVHDILGGANGELVAVIPHGEMRQAFAEFTGINAARGLGLLLMGSQKQDGIRCGIAVFKVDDGKAKAEPLVFDTDSVVVTGSGGFDFDSEDLDLRLHGQTKKFDPIHVRAPITIKGTLGKPAIGLDAKSLAAQGGVAALLGVVATPVAAIAAFIDPGFGKNQDCTALLSSPAEKSAEHPSPARLSKR